MKNISKMLKCRALFIQSVSCIFGEDVELNEEFAMLLNSFCKDNLTGNEDYFNLIFYFDLDDNFNVVVREEEEWKDEMYQYLNYFTVGNVSRVKEIYDDIGDEDVAKISVLAEQFVDYMCQLYEISADKIKIRS